MPLPPPQSRRCPPRPLLAGGSGRFVILDLETTGLIRAGRPMPQIVEIACLEVDGQGVIRSRWETTLQASCASEPQALRAHGLSQERLKGSPRFEQIAPWLAAHLHGSVLVAHNLFQFDAPILAAAFRQSRDAEVELGHGIDTLPRPSRGFGLDRLRAEHGIAAEAHTAMGDALTVLELLKRGLLVPPEARAPFRARHRISAATPPAPVRPRAALARALPAAKVLRNQPVRDHCSGRNRLERIQP